MSKDPNYRPMPLGYVLGWIAVNTLVYGWQQLGRYGWPGVTSTEVATGILIGGIAGGLFWGWLLWRFWLYRKFPQSGKG